MRHGHLHSIEGDRGIPCREKKNIGGKHVSKCRRNPKTLADKPKRAKKEVQTVSVDSARRKRTKSNERPLLPKTAARGVYAADISYKEEGAEQTSNINRKGHVPSIG